MVKSLLLGSHLSKFLNNDLVCFGKLICRSGQNALVAAKQVSMYSKYGGVRKVFDKIRQQNSNSNASAFPWNALLKEYAWNGPYEEALVLYSQMQKAAIPPDTFTYAFLFKACAGLSALLQGRNIHSHIIATGFEANVCVGTALLDMYARCSRIEEARQVFDEMHHRDVVAWNAMIAGYVQIGYVNKALELFWRMKRDEDVVPNSATLVNVVLAFAELGDLKQGKCMHEYIIGFGFGLDPFVASSLIDMYAKCGSVELARQVFDKLSVQDVASWNAMIAGYAQNGYSKEALRVFHEMLQNDIVSNSAGLASALSACADLRSLELGKWIHDYITKNDIELNVFITTSLIDMYAKCGRLEVARQIFEKMPERDVVSWNVMIGGYVIHGHAMVVLELFSQMEVVGMKPNGITYGHVLSACRLAGLVDEGCRYFDSMMQNYQIGPNMKHYLYMVDLLSRTGHLREALTFIKRMPIEPDPTVWRALLGGGAYKLHKDVDTELGRRVAECT